HDGRACLSRLHPAFVSYRRRPSSRSTLFPYTTLFRSYRSSPPQLSLTAINSAREECRAPQPPRKQKEPDRIDPPRTIHLDSSEQDRKSTRLNSSHEWSSYAVFCLKKKTWLPQNGRRQV